MKVLHTLLDALTLAMLAIGALAWFLTALVYVGGSLDLWKVPSPPHWAVSILLVIVTKILLREIAISYPSTKKKVLETLSGFITRKQNQR